MAEKSDIVISGVSGRFSNCANVDQLRDKLYKGVDMTFENEERWPKGTYGLPSKSGALLDLQNFDASFFGLSDDEADQIDPSTRCSIETTFEALCDAGLNPWDLGSRKVGLFHGQTNNEMSRFSSENDKLCIPQLQERLLGHIFNIKNGVYLYETACSSSFTALNEAFVQLSQGYIDLAVVSCANIMWSPAIALSYHRLGLTSQIGSCRFLDANASGYGRSETCVTIILERSCDAHRIHGQLISSFNNCDGYKPQGITYPSWESQASLISKSYKENNIDPTQLEYFECHGTGTEVGDMVEVKALWSVLGVGRSKLPLLLGSIKSNLGHSEAGSGLSSLIKCLLIFKCNSIPPNLHYEQPSPHVSELESGFVAPVIKVTPFKGQYIPINNFGFGGANVHVTLGRPLINDSDKVNSSKEETMLILCCGRNEISLQTMMNAIMTLKSQQINSHFVHLINRYSYFMSTSINLERRMNHRSYIISSPCKPLEISSANELASAKVPICFAFPGAGCQIDDMIQPFMSLKPFRESIEDSMTLIDPDGSKGVKEILLNARQSHWKIFAMGVFQIAVVDTLRSIGIVPDIIVGHSFGEYCCAYADGVLSKVEMLDICYQIIQVISSIINESPTFKSCSMISIALKWDQLSPLIPENLYPACFNTHDNITLAGYTEDIVQFSNYLKTQNIFHRLIDSCGFGFHTIALGKMIDLTRQKLSHYSKIYRKRSDRWIISHDTLSMNFNQPINIQTLCVEIIANTVQFESACQSIPKNALCIEIAPRKFLTSLLKCNLKESLIVEVPFKVDNKQFTQIEVINPSNHVENRDYPKLPESFYPSLGNLYLNGCTINLESLCNHSKNRPIPIEVPFLSPLIKLDHSTPRLVRRFPEHFNGNNSAQEKITLDINEKSKHNGCFYYNGHQVMPIGSLVHSIWTKFAALTASNTNDLGVCLERIKLHQLSLFGDSKLSTSVTLMIKFLPTNQGKYKFTMSRYSDGLLIMSGFVSIYDDSGDGDKEVIENLDKNSNEIDGKLFYGILSRQGFHYQDDLKNIIQVNCDSNVGIMNNHKDWIVRFESLIQLASFSNNQGKINSLSEYDYKMNNFPVRLDEIHCIPDKSFNESTVPMVYDKFSDIIRVKSIYIRGIHFGSFHSQLPIKIISEIPTIETFIPRFNQTICQSLENCVQIMIDHLIEFTLDSPITLITTTPSKSNGHKNSNQIGDLIAFKLNQVRSSPCQWIKIDSLKQSTQTSDNNNKLDDNETTNRLLIIETDNTNLIDIITGPVISKASNCDFIIVHQTIPTTTNNNNYSTKFIDYLKSNGLVIVSCLLSNRGYFYLIRWSINPILTNVTKVNSSFQPVPFSNLSKLLPENQQLHWLMVNNLSSSSGLIDRLEFGNQVNKQTIQLKWLINELDENDNNYCFDEFIPIGLKYTVLRNGVQGSYHYLPINLSSPPASSSLSSSSKLLSPTTITESNFCHVNNESLIQLLSRSCNEQLSSIVICCNQIPDCDSLIGYSRVSDDQGEIGIIKYNQPTNDYTIIHRWVNVNHKSWSLEESSTIPIPYSLAYYGLIVVGRLLRGETILIVNGHSSVGCALISICLSFCCTIYLSVETEDQKVNLLRRFPSLVDEQFLIATSGEDIEQTIKILTNSYGCDLIVNTSANKSTPSYNDNNKPITTGTSNPNQKAKGNHEFMLKCLSTGGRCVDLNKFPMSIDDDLGLAVFLQNITYYGATPEGLFQSFSSSKKLETTGKGNHPLDRAIDLLGQDMTRGVISPLIGIDSTKITQIKLTSKIVNQCKQLPFVDLIIGEPGDIELEIIEKSRKYDKISHFILIPINQSSQYVTFSSSCTAKSSSSSSPPFSTNLSSSSAASSSYSFPLTPISSISHQTLTPTSSSSSPSSNKPSLNYHSYIINQLELLGCSFVDINNFTDGKLIDDKETIKYQQVLKDISQSYKINKVFLVYRSFYPDNNQHINHYHFQHHHHNNQQNPNSYHHYQHNNNHFANQLMIELLDYITNSSEISINFLTLISCSLAQDNTFIWPQLVRKCQQYGKRSGITSITINLTDLLSSDDPNYWSQLDQHISQLYCQLIGSNNVFVDDDNNNNDNRKDKNYNNNRKVNGVYKLTCKMDNQ